MRALVAMTFDNDSSTTYTFCVVLSYLRISSQIKIEDLAVTRSSCIMSLETATCLESLRILPTSYSLDTYNRVGYNNIQYSLE